MDSRKIIKLLETEGAMKEVCEIKSFCGYRENAKGKREEIKVEILDRGTDSSELRYTCIARSENGKEASGNPASTLEVTIATVHWNELY